jgi:hypothetical protein
MLARLVLVGFLGGAVAVLGCSSGSSSSSAGGGGGSKGSGGTNFSCDEKTSQGHVCEQYDDLPASLLTQEQMACKSSGGTAGTACSSANRLGICAVTIDGFMYKVSYYSDVGDLTAPEAQASCKNSGGTWTAG